MEKNILPERVTNQPRVSEEVLANAVYHRSYELRNTIEVNVRLDKIEVLSFPGPLPPVDNEMLQKERIVARNYRNRRIGDFLKELQLTEGRSTGFPKIYKAMKKNGSPEPQFETDEDQYYSLAMLPVHDRLKEKGQAGGQASKKDLNDMERSILEVLAKGPSSRGDLLDSLGMDKRTGYFRRMIDRLMDNNFVTYTYPDTPRHPDQKYEITNVGKQQIA